MIFADSNVVIQRDLEYITSYELDWTSLSNKTILVSGGSGLLGSYLVKSFLAISQVFDLGMRVICIARRSESIQKRLTDVLVNPNLMVLTRDITIPMPAGLPRADIIIHAASQASPKYYGIDPVGTLMANVAGTINLLNYSIKHKSDRFMYFSSGEVYGASPGLDNISEQDYGYLDPIQVRSCYAESKRIGETMCAAWSHQFGLHTSVVRPFHTYGPGMAHDDGRVFADFVADVVHCRDIVLKSDGSAKRSFCYIADATLGFLTVLLRGGSGEAYNVANPNAEISMRDLAYTLAGLYPERGIGVRYEISTPNNSYLESPILQSCPSISKISKLGWTPHTGIKEGFSRAINSYLQ